MDITHLDNHKVRKLCFLPEIFDGILTQTLLVYISIGKLLEFMPLPNIGITFFRIFFENVKIDLLMFI